MKFVKKSHVYIAIILPLILILGCASFTTNAFKSLGVTATVVDTARQVYNNEFYDQGKITPEFDAKVLKAYTAYQSSMKLAMTAVQDYQKLADLGQKPDVTMVNKALADLTKAVTDVLALFNQAGVPKVVPPPLQLAK